MNGRVLVIPKVSGIGGMVSFKNKFSSGAEKAGVSVSDTIGGADPSAVLVIGGTRDILPLISFRLKGIKVAQRLDGINWIHRVKPTGFKHKLRAEYGNFILAFIRRFIASEIVYQSEFSRWWWNDQYGTLDKPTSVIHNAVDTEQYTPSERQANAPLRLLVVEGSMGGGYEGGLANAVNLCDGLVEEGFDIELHVVGEVSRSLQEEWNKKAKKTVVWHGTIPRADVPAMMNSADVYFSADVHPACPNAVIEALACGLPVAAFDTGSLKELVSADCGVVVPYGTNSWRLEKPDIASLVKATSSLLKDLPRYRANARKFALERFTLDEMVKKYLVVLLGEHDQEPYQ